MSNCVPSPVPGSALESGLQVIDVLACVRATFEEMPGLCLTRDQAARLLGLNRHDCSVLLSGLVDSGYLKLTRAGYVRT